MLRRAQPASWIVVVALASACVSMASAQDDAPRKAPKPCHEVDKEVRYRGLGYQHTVVIRNTCERTIACTIKANSNPETLSARVDAKQTQSVVVNAGSAASEFSADVECK